AFACAETCPAGTGPRLVRMRTRPRPWSPRFAPAPATRVVSLGYFAKLCRVAPRGARSGLMRSAERVGLRVPESAGQAETSEDLAHLGGLRTPGIGLETSPVPGHRQPPELREAHERSDRRLVGLAPLAHPLFRPEEEHAASREDDVVPPVRG